MDFDKLNRSILPLIKEAGEYAYQKYRDGATFTLKGDDSFVTTVDTSLQKTIGEALQKLYPDIPVIGEEQTNEQYDINNLPEYLWAVDPVDGTHAFATGLPGWCVCIGLLKNGIPLYGAVFAPAIDELYYGMSGRGAYMNNKKITPLSPASYDKNASLCIDSKYLRDSGSFKFEGKVRSFGSSALHSLFAARGAVSAAQSCRINIWDIAAPAAIAIEAGCIFRMLNGKNVDFKSMCRPTRSEDDIVSGPEWAVEHAVQCFQKESGK